MQATKGRGFTLTHSFVDETEEAPLVLTTVSVSLADANGTVVATEAATEGSPGDWSVSFTAQPLGLYVATWDGDSGSVIDETEIEVVGRYLFSVLEARNSDDFLSDATTYPGAEIIEYRETVDTEFARITGRSFVPRVTERTHISDGTGEFIALIPDAKEVVGATIDGEPVADLSNWTVNTLGRVTTTDRVANGALVRIKVQYGFSVTPRDIKRVGMIRLRSMIAAESSGIPDRATTWQPEEGGTFRLATPGVGPWKTGIPEVDSTLAHYTLDTVLAVYAGG